MSRRTQGFSTQAVHAGESGHRCRDSVTVPIFQTSNFLMNDNKYTSGSRLDNLYSRLGNPTVSALVEKLNVLCGASHGVFFSSGMAAITCALGSILRPGDSVVSCRTVYGGTLSLFDELRMKGINVRTFDVRSIDEIHTIIDQSTRILFSETLTNPTCRLVDIDKLATIARSHGITLIVDNTFLSPFNFRSLDHGADIEVHSISKYINGHSDVVAGFACTNDTSIYDRLWRTMTTGGSNAGPVDAFLAMRGAKTLALRMRVHNRNGEEVARLLSEHPLVKRVEHPALAKDVPRCFADCEGFGGIVYFELPSREDALKFMRTADLLTEATSLGGVETLVTMPSLTSHAGTPEDGLEEAGVSSSGIRLSLGIEDTEDLLASIRDALSVI